MGSGAGAKRYSSFSLMDALGTRENFTHVTETTIFRPGKHAARMADKPGWWRNFKVKFRAVPVSPRMST
jgi:hypothetical protein